MIFVKKLEVPLRLITQNFEMSSHKLIPYNIKFIDDILAAKILKLSYNFAFTVKKLLIMEH